MNAVTQIKPEAIASVSVELQKDIEQFLYAEAELLDQGYFQEWYDLQTDEINYRMPVQAKRIMQTQREGHHAGYNGYIFDENKMRLGARVRKILSGRDHIERPASLMRRMVTNVRIQPLGDGRFKVLSYFHITRIRHDYQVDTYTGERDDILIKANNDYGFMLDKRFITLDQTVHLGGGIGFFF